MSFLISLALCILVLMGTTAFHFVCLQRLLSFERQQSVRALHIPVVLVLIVTIHVIEISAYALTYALASQLGIGGLKGDHIVAFLDYFYFAAETYSTVGYGDILPSGETRLIASISTLNGLLLTAWSGAFLFNLVQKTTSYQFRK